MKNTASLLILLFSLSHLGSSLAGAREEGLKAFRAGNYAQVLKLWQPLAEQGDTELQYNLGVMYSQGRGVEKDTQKAIHWLQLAASQGDRDALARLGKIYALQKKYTLAEPLLRQAAEQGQASAQYNLAVLYANGWGLPEDQELALRWYYKAAEQGHPAAQFNLGVMHENGQGIPADYKEAFRWYDKAARQGDADAQANLGRLYFQGKGTPRDKLLAYAWFSAAAEQGVENAKKNKAYVFNKLSTENRLKADHLAKEYIRQFNRADKQ